MQSKNNGIFLLYKDAYIREKSTYSHTNGSQHFWWFRDSERNIFFYIKAAKVSSKQLCNSEMALRQLLRCKLTLKSHRSSGNTVWSRILIAYLQVETMPCRLPQEPMNYVQYKKNTTFRWSLKAISPETEDSTHFICLPPKGGTAKHRVTYVVCQIHHIK